MVKLTIDQLDIFKTEWSHCEKGIGLYDDLIFKIRGWAASVSGALLTAGFTLHLKEIALVSGLVVTMFWMIDAINKDYQSVFILRSRQIQQVLYDHIHDSVSLDALQPPMIGWQFKNKFGRGPGSQLNSIITRAAYPGVVAFYVALILACTVCYFLISKTK